MSSSVVEYSTTEAALIILREKYENVSYMVDVPAGMKEAREARAEIRGYRIDLEKLRKEIKAPALEHCRAIDSEAKRITAELTSLEQPIAEQIKAVEARKEAERQAEIDRVVAIKERIESFRSASEIADQLPEFIHDRIVVLEAIAVGDSFGEFQDEAADAKASALARLKEHFGAAVIREAEKKELEELREAKARQEREEAEKKLAAERAEREAEEARLAKIAEEQKVIADAQAAESLRLANERAAIRKAEEDKKAEEERIAAAAKKLEYPGDDALIAGIAEHFSVDADTAVRWVAEWAGLGQ